MTNELQVALDPGDTHLKPRELAARLKMHVVTLANWRVRGVGPKFVKSGSRVRYPVREVEAWEQSRLRQNTAVG